MNKTIQQFIREMTLEEKASLCSGKDFWNTKTVERLGIPGIKVSDGPNGLRTPKIDSKDLGFEAKEAVSFPPACLSACSFDEELLHAMGERLGAECRAEGVDVLLGPSANMKRSPLCGRNFEYFSEDPYLGSKIAAAYVKGLQSKGVGACVKHFTANNQEYRRQTVSAEVSERALREIYLAAFEGIVKDAQPDTMMCAYNRINGEYVSERHEILTDILRGEWGYEGFVMSDWSAVNDRVKAVAAGLDLAMPGEGPWQDQQIVDAVKSGTLDESVVDTAVERILRIAFKYQERKDAPSYDMDADHTFAQKVAEESMVLLKNEDHILPLPKQGKKIAFIGAFAETPRFQGGGSASVNAHKVDCALDAAKAYAEVSYSKGYLLEEDRIDADLLEDAVKAATEADIAVIFAGLPDSFESEGYDRADMRMPDNQNVLIAQIAAVQENTVVVLHNGSPVEMPWADDVKAILESYLGGEAVGQAQARILFGDVNPSGKLAESHPIKLSDNPSYLHFPGDGETVEYAEGVFIGYRYYDSKDMAVRFPFGHGLSYTSFAYSDLQFSTDSIRDTDTVTVSCKVKNIGAVAGKEVVQLYVSDLTRSTDRPVKELKDFCKVSLAPGEETVVSFELNKRSFAWFSPKIHDWYAATGDYRILIGSSSRDIRLEDTLHLESSTVLPMKVTRNTTINELMLHRATKPIIMGLLDQIVAYMNGMQKQDGGEGVEIPAEQLIRMLESSPLRFFNTLMGMSMEQIDGMIMQMQMAVDAAGNTAASAE